MKTLKKVPLRLIILNEGEYIPEPNLMEPGVIYYSKEFSSSNHLCVCGCGQQTPLPIKESEWQLDIETISVTPSILHRNGCRSHYIITNGIANLV